VGGVKADGWIYKWESCLSESGKRRFLPRAPFHIFQFLSFLFNTTFYENPKGLLPLERNLDNFILISIPNLYR